MVAQASCLVAQRASCRLFALAGLFWENCFSRSGPAAINWTIISLSQLAGSEERSRFRCPHWHDASATTAGHAFLLHDQHDDQLAVTDLRAANDKWACLIQFRCGFQYQLLFLEKFQVQHVGIHFLVSGIDLQRKIFAGGEPIFLARLQGLARLTNELELRITKKSPQCAFDLHYFRRCPFGWWRIARDN